MERFAVDNDINDRTVKHAIRALKRTIKFGKRAEYVLEQLEKTGHFDGRVPVIYRNLYDRNYTVSVHKFPRYVDVSRNDIKNWDSISIKFGQKGTGHHGGTQFHTVPVRLIGARYVGELGNKSIHEEFNEEIGLCRLKSGGTITFSPSRIYDRCVFKLYRKYNPNGDDVKAMASIIAECLTGFNLHRCYSREIPQKIVNLKEAIPGWLIEDGVIQRFINDVYDLVLVMKIQDS